MLWAAAGSGLLSGALVPQSVMVGHAGGAQRPAQGALWQILRPFGAFRQVNAPLRSPEPAADAQIVRRGQEGNSFYEAGVGVKPPAAGFRFTWRFLAFSFLKVLFALVGPVHL